MPEQHHAVSHHRDDPELIAKKAKIDVYRASLLGYFLDKLRKTSDGDGNLLDQSMIMYGGGLGNGNLHEHTKLPVLVAGSSAADSRPGNTSNTRKIRPWRTCCLRCSTRWERRWKSRATARG